MSNVPTPKEIPPTPQQVDRTLQAVVGHAQHLIAEDPRHFAALRASFLALYTHPTFQLILGIPSQITPTTTPPNPQLKAELSELKSNIQALSKAVTDLQPKVTKVQATAAQPPLPTGNTSAQGKGHSPPPPPTFASKAASKPRPSLVLNLGDAVLEKHIQGNLVSLLNRCLFQAGHIEISLSAAKFTKKGNLVLTAHHTNTQSQLDSVSAGLAGEVERILKAAKSPTTAPVTARANVKWSKILINSVPVGIMDNRGPWTPDECHRSLSAHNPSYYALKVTQKPSWVRPPSTLTIGSHSSLVMAFEDPDGTIKRTLLSSKHLYIHGTCAKVARWKESPHPTPKPPNASEACNPSPVNIESRSSTPSEDNAGSVNDPSPKSLPVTRSKPTNPQRGAKTRSRGGPR